MENKLLTYILQMQKQSSTQSVPKLPKAQKGKEYVSMKNNKDWFDSRANWSNTGNPKYDALVRESVLSGRFGFDPNTNQLVKLKESEWANVSDADKEKATATYGKKSYSKRFNSNTAAGKELRKAELAESNKEMIKNPLFYAPAALAAAPFVAGAASAAAPILGASMNAPMAGVAGLTGTNVMNAGFAYEAAKNLPNVGRSIKTAYQNPTLSNVGNATAETALTALNALPFAAEASRGVTPLANEIKNAFTLTAAQKNLKDLNYAKKVYGPLGYQIPENLERIAQSDVLTDRTVRGLVNRDNSVYRGVNTDLEAIRERLANRDRIRSRFNNKPEAIDKFDVIIGNLKKANVDVNDPEEIAKYMATHIPAETGAGRAGLDDDVFKKGLDALYTSNSARTAEGYTYGDGYIVKAKKPTDFSSTSRKAWIDNNIPDIQTGKDYKLPWFSSKPITFKMEEQIIDKRALDNYRGKLGREKLEAEYPSTLAEYNGETWNALHPEHQKIKDRINQLKQIADEEYNLAADPYKEKLFTVQDRLTRRSENYKLNNTSTFKKVLNVPITMKDLIMESHYSRKVQNLSNKNSEAWMDAHITPYLEKYPELANAYPEVNPYAHYINIGKPGQKVLEPVSLKKITPETWIHKSRGHEGVHSRQATRREFGGMYSSGGPIVDPMGQWAHPGQVTRIPSANITMQGVPYPVLGVASNGKQVMMQPGQDYNFGGASYVDEYPMAQHGGWLDKYQPEPMRQDATRNVVPRKMTDKERLEAVATSDQAQKKALNTAKEVITERQKNKATKGDLNTPGSWNIKEKARLFPSSVGGAGEMFDEYINPATYVGILGDALGESVAARDPKGIATSLGLSALAGRLGLDPLGSGIKAVKTLTKQLPNAAKYTAGSMYKTYNENIYPILNKEKLAPYADKIAKLNKINAATKESLKSGELRKRLINQGLTEEEVSNMKVPNLAFFADNKSPGTSYGRYQDVNNLHKLDGININFDQLDRLKNRLTLTPEAAYEHEVGHFLQRPLADKNPLNDLNKYNELLKNYKKDLRIYKKEGKNLSNTFGLDKNKISKGDERERMRFLSRAMKEKDEAAVNWFDRKPQLPERPNYESELDKKVRDLNFNNENSFSNYFNKDHEAYPFLREMRQTMVDEGFIKDKYQDINKDAISNFLNSKTKNRLKEALNRKERESNTDMLHTLLKTLPAVAPAVVASQSQEMMANGGYTVTRSSDRKGKTHKVTGPGGVVKYFGDSKLGQHPKDPERKAAFYARHKKNLDGNPFFRAFARKTWEDGGTIPQYQFAGAVSSTDSLRHQAAKMMDFEAKKGSPTGTGLSNWGYHQSQMPYNMQSPNWKQPRTKDEAVNMYMQEIAPRLQNFPSAMEKGEAGDFLYNTGRDPRVYMLDQYLKSKGQSGIPNRSAYNVDTKTPAWTPQLQQSLNDEWKRNQDDIYKLPVNDRRVLLNKGRDFYYQNINKKADGTPNDSYKATWKPRIWESVNTYKKGGQTDDDREMLSGVADMLRRVNDVNNRKQIANYMMNNFREENVTFEPNKFLKSANAFKEGGEMIRRADGSYSPRGLWDNIRDNAGSGKKPTKQMLEQERKINSMQFGGLIKAQTGKQVKSKPLFSQSQIDLYNRLVAEKEAAEKEAAAKKLAAMREYYENRPHFSQNNSPREEPTPWVDPVLGRIDRENNEKYADSDGGFENFAEFLDPTGISSWDDVGRTFRNPSASNMERGFALFSALPIVGKLGKLAKGTKAINTAVKGNALQKIGRGALKGAAKTIDIVTGGPAMRYFDQTINPLSRGFGTLTEKAVGQIPYSGVRKAFEIGSDFNQMRRFQDAVLIPGFNQLDNYMTQPANSQKPWWKQ